MAEHSILGASDTLHFWAALACLLGGLRFALTGSGFGLDFGLDRWLTILAHQNLAGQGVLLCVHLNRVPDGQRVGQAIVLRLEVVPGPRLLLLQG